MVKTGSKLKEFLKPTVWKIVITLVLFGLLFMQGYCLFKSIPGEGTMPGFGGRWNYSPGLLKTCKNVSTATGIITIPIIIVLLIIIGLIYLLIPFALESSFLQLFGYIFTFILSYLEASLIIWIINLIRKKPKR